MHATTVAIDLAKDVFELAYADADHRIVARKRLSRRAFARVLDNQGPLRVVMEACGSAHYWARRFASQGHTLRLLPARDVRPYVRRNKTDRTDAAGLLEADRCAQIDAVPIKSPEQQGVQALHRIREQWKAQRTATINLMRGVLREFGVVIPLGAAKVRPAVLCGPGRRRKRTADGIASHAGRHAGSLDRTHACDARDRATTASLCGCRSGLPALPAGAGYRRAHGHRFTRQRWPARPLPQRTTLCCLDGPCATRAFLRKPTSPRTHQQTRRWLLAHAADSRRARDTACSSCSRAAPAIAQPIANLGADAAATRRSQ